MSPLRLLLVTALSGALVSCAYPVTTIEQGGVSAGLYFPNSPVGARVLIDGADAGEAASYDGRKAVLRVEPGKHHVVVSAGSSTFYDRNVYVGGDSRLAIEVR